MNALAREANNHMQVTQGALPATVIAAPDTWTMQMHYGGSQARGLISRHRSHEREEKRCLRI